MNLKARVVGRRAAGKAGAVVFAGLLAAASASVGAAPLPGPVFVIGDGVTRSVGSIVNFWGAKWWKNNPMTGEVGRGVASFKGYAPNTECNEEEGTWTSRPGNSSNPPDTLPEEEDILVIVTDSVLKDGSAISGSIVQILTVEPDTYGPNPGHPGYGEVTGIFNCLEE